MAKNPWAIHVSARMQSLLVESHALSEVIGHNGLRGQIRELFVKQFLIPFLPPHIGIGTGEIINHEGKCSRQLDVVLYNKERVPPILVSGSDTGIFPWESVVAVIEVKSKLTNTALKEAHLNAHSVHDIYSSLDEPWVLVGGLKPKENMKSPTPIPYYIFAFDSDLSFLNETEEFQTNSGARHIGKEGRRLFQSLDSFFDDVTKLESKLQRNDVTDEEKEVMQQEIVTLRSIRNNIFGLCVAGTEWTEGCISFADMVYPDYGAEPFRLASKWNYCWHTHFNEEENYKNVLYFLNRLIELSNEMPKCRAHYGIARYLTAV